MMEKPQKSPFYSQGVHFSCTRCSACCRHESGFVFLSQKDVSALTAALGMEYSEFVAVYCRWVPTGGSGQQLSLKEKSNYDCILWSSEQNGCSVYNARPVQCRAFPFWSSVLRSEKDWKSTALDCPGVDHGELVPFDTIEKWLAVRRNEPIISRNSTENAE